MNREEAKLMMQEGHKVTHRYFSDDEYIKLNDQLLEDEMGYLHDYNEFMSSRTEECWDSDWRIYNETK